MRTRPAGLVLSAVGEARRSDVVDDRELTRDAGVVPRGAGAAFAA